MKLKPYPKYKDSGIKWIGKIPEGWEVKRSGYYIKPFMGYPFDSEKFDLEGMPLIRIRDLDTQNVEICFNGEYLPQYVISKGDHLIGMDGNFKSVIWSSGEALLNQRVMKIIFTKKPILFQRYFFYAIDGPLKVINDLSYSTTVKHLSDDDVRKCLICVPSVEEQQKIASFLDSKTSELNKTIGKDKKLIALLKEKRTALINHAVTKGLDKNGKMKKANLLICDEKPENWQIIRIKFVIRLSRGVDLSNDDFEEGNIPVYGSNGIIGYHNEATSKGPGVTVGRSGSVGEVNFVNEERYWAHNTSLYLQENYGNNVRYIYYLLSILDLKHLAAGSAVGTLNRNYIHDLFVSLPSKQEQQKIVKYLNKATSKIDKTIKKIEDKIRLLEEYKKSLIHYVVTGKVDVRGVEA